MLIMIGCLLCFIGPLLLYLEATTATCNSYIFVTNLGVALVLNCLLIKSHRIWRVFAEPFKIRSSQSNLSLPRMLMKTFAVVLLQMISLAVVVGLSPAESAIALLDTSEYGRRQRVCSQSVIVNLVLLVWNLGYFIVGMSSV